MAKKKRSTYRRPLVEYAKLYGWSYRSVIRAKHKEWPLDAPEQLLALARVQRGTQLPLKKLQTLVGEPPQQPAMPQASSSPIEPDHYSDAVFSLQPTYARLWTATDRAFKSFKLSPSPLARDLWTKFRKALTTLMRDLPDIDRALRGLLEVADVKRTADKTIIWMRCLMDSLERHTLERAEFKPLASKLQPLLASELKQVHDKFALDLQDPNPPTPSKKNPIADLLSLATEERQAFLDFISAPEIHAQRAKQSTYLHTLEQLRHLAKSAPAGLGDITYKAQVVEVRWMRASTELVAGLRIMGSRLSTNAIFAKMDPVDVALAFQDEQELLLDRYQRGEEPACFGNIEIPPPDYVPYVSPPVYEGPSRGRDSRLAPYFAARAEMVVRNGGKRGDTNPPKGFSKAQLKKLHALRVMTSGE